MQVVESLELGDHIAFFYREVAEQLEVVIPYVTDGLKKNQRCLYIADDGNVSSIAHHLEEAGVDVEAEGRRGALVVTSKGKTYLRHGVFEPRRMIAELKEEVRKSRSRGFEGLRATGEMTWALDLPSALSGLLEYELQVSIEYPTEFMALCQYDETRFAAPIVQAMAEIHPVVIRRGELHRQSPALERFQHSFELSDESHCEAELAAAARPAA